MAKSTTLTVNIEADASDAVSAFDKAGGAVKEYGDKADDAAKKSRNVSEGIENTGDSAANVTTGLRDLGGAMESMGGTVGKMGTAMVAASTAFEAMDGAATLYKGAQSFATMAASGFTKAMNVMKIAILSNPIFLIAAIVIAIAVAFVLLWKNCETFRRIVTAAFNAVMGVIKTVWSWIKANWPLLLVILTGPIGIAVALIVKYWDKIKAGAQSVWNWISTTWAKLSTILTQPFRDAWNVISGIFDRIRGAIDAIIGKIKQIKFPDLNPFNNKAAPAGFAAPRVPGVARAPSARAATASSPSIVVNGAIDPENVARQIRRILAGHNTRVGTATAI